MLNAKIEKSRPLRKEREGVVIRHQDKTLVVKVDRRIRHKLYGKEILRFKRFFAHDEKNEARVGDVVRIMETRPLSKLKRWRLVEILRKPES